MFSTKFIALSALAENANKNGQEITQEEIDAVNLEFAAEGLEVTLMGSADYSALQDKGKQVDTLSSAHADAVKVLAPDTKEEDLASANVAELATKALAAKDQEISTLQAKLDNKGEKPKPTATEGQEDLETETEENPYRTSIDDEADELLAKFQ